MNKNKRKPEGGAIMVSYIYGRVHAITAKAVTVEEAATGKLVSLAFLDERDKAGTEIAAMQNKPLLFGYSKGALVCIAEADFEEVAPGTPGALPLEDVVQTFGEKETLDALEGREAETCLPLQ
jgi:hypothetical protein